MGIMPASVCAQQTVDQLKKEINSIKDKKARMDSLYTFSRRYVNDEQEYYLLTELEKEARAQHDDDRLIHALRNLTRWHYNCDSPTETIEKACANLEALNLKTENFNHAVVDVNSYLCYQYIYIGRFVKVADIATEFMKNYKEDDYANIVAAEILTLLYTEQFQETDALEWAKKGYELCKKHPEYDWKLIFLCESVLGRLNYSGLIEEALPYLNDFEKLIEQNRPKQSTKVIDDYTAMWHAYSIAYYLQKGDLAKAKEHVMEAEPLDISYDPANQCTLNYLLSCYYVKVGNLERAWELVSEELSDGPIKYFQQQADMLDTLGRHEDAFQHQRSLTNRLMWAYDKSFKDQLNDMRTKYDVYDLQVQNTQRDRVIMILVVAFGICVIVFMIVLYVRQRIASKKIERANMTQKIFLQNMSHELRTPLNAICGFSQILADPEMKDILSPEDMEDYGKIITSNTDMLTTLMNDILEASDLENGTYKMNFEQHSPTEITEAAYNTVSYRCPGTVRMYWTSDIDEGLTITTDKLRSQQIITNFLTNAIKHTRKGEIHLHCTTKEREGFVTYSVTDTGEGVPADKADVIFRRFEKLDTFKQGTGLGLAICTSLAELMHGEVKLDTTYTDGARFVFHHPLDKKVDDNA